MSNLLLEGALAQGQAESAIDATKIREMHLDIGDARSLEGIEHFVCLESLEVIAPKTVSLRGLAGLPRLRSLRVSAYGVKDLAEVARAPLRRLELVAQRLPDLNGLASETLLELHVWNAGLKTLAGIELPRLRRLEVSMNKIADLSPLSMLRSLRNLSLEDNPAGSIEALASLPELRVVSLSGMAKVTDLAPLEALRKLSRLVLTGVGAKRRDAVAHVAPAAIVDAERSAPRPPDAPLAWPEAAVQAGLANEDEVSEIVQWDPLEWNAADWLDASAMKGLHFLLGPASTELSALRALPSVGSLVVRCAMDRPDDGAWTLRDVDFSGLAHAPRLTRLDVQHPLDGLARLPALPGLRHLKVVGDEGTPVSLAGVERFESLLTLNVVGNMVGEEALTRMSRVQLSR